MTTATATLPERSRLTLAETVADGHVMAVRQLRKDPAPATAPTSA